jgi:hypothetical protein
MQGVYILAVKIGRQLSLDRSKELGSGGESRKSWGKGIRIDS